VRKVVDLEQVDELSLQLLPWRIPYFKVRHPSAHMYGHLQKHEVYMPKQQK